MTTNEQHPVLVLGATGKTGRRVAARLRDRGVPVRAASRSTAPAFDWDDRASWDAALRGARAVYAPYAPDLAVPGAAETVAALAEQAAAAGVERIGVGRVGGGPVSASRPPREDGPKAGSRTRRAVAR